MAVRDPVMEPGIANISGSSGEDRGVAHHLHRALITVVNIHDLESITFNIAVVAQQDRQVDRDAGVLLQAEHAVRIVERARAIGVGDRRIVDRMKIEGEATGDRLAAIADHIVKADRTVDVFVRHEFIAAIGQLVDPAARS